MEKWHIELSQTRSVADSMRFLDAAHSIKLSATNWRIIIMHAVPPKAVVNKLLGGAKRKDHHDILCRNIAENRDENNNPKFRRPDIFCLDAAVIRALQLDPDDSAEAAAGASPLTAKDAEGLYFTLFIYFYLYKSGLCTIQDYKLHTHPCHTPNSAPPVHPTAHQRHQPARRAGPSASEG